MKNTRDGHTIDILTFDIQIPKEKDYQQVADIISSISEVELPLFLQELLDTYQIKDQTIQIEKIELDLGDISLTQSRSQLISQFKNSLKIWFKETFSSESLEKSSEIKTYSLQERDFTLLKYFISYGKIPWWGLNPPFIPDQSLKKYIREAAVKTKNLVFDVGREKSSRKRIIYQFNEDTLYQLFGILSPRPASFFRQYATELTYIHQKQKIVEEEDLAFKKVLQELILTYLISHKATSIDQTAFFRKQLLMLSKQYGIDYRTILDRINDIIEKLPEHFTSQSTIKLIVKKLIKQDFDPISVPQNISSYSFADYANILEMFYHSKPEQISGKYKSKRERDRFIRQMLRQNKQKTILLLKKIHRKFQLNKEQTALLFSENVLLELLTIGSSIAVETIDSLIEPLKKIQHKFFVFSSSPLSIKSIVYTHFFFKSFTETHTSEEVTLQVLKNIAKIYHLPFKNLITYIPAISSANLSKLKLAEQRKNAVKNPNKSELKKILFGLLKNNQALFEEFLKKIRLVHPTLGSYIKSEAFYIFAIQLLSEKSTTSSEFYHFINEIAPVLSKNISINTLDFQKSLLITKDSLSSKLKNQLVKSLKGNTDLSTPGLKQLGTLSKPLDNLNLEALRNILHGLLKNNQALFEEFLKKVRINHPTLSSYIQSEAFYIFAIELFLITPSDVNKTDKWLLKFILKLSQKAKIPVKTFLYPLLGKDILIPGRLIKELRQIYAFIIEKSPTYSDTVDPIFKSNESLEKLIQILGAKIFEDDSLPEDIDKATLFLEILWLKENDILSKIVENRFNPLLPVLLVTGLPEEALQFLQMKMAGETYPDFIEGIDKINKWIQQYNIIKLPKNKLNLWLKQNSTLFLIQFGNKPWKIEDYYYFILEKLQKERLLQWKELEQTIQHIPENLQSEILYFISDQNQLPTPSSWRDQQFFTDLIVHYITTGVIQPWLNKPYLELNEIIYLFSDALKSENAHFIKAILSISFNQARLKRIFQLLDKTDPLDFIRVIDNLQSQKSIVAFYESLTVLAKKFISSSNIETVIIELFLEKKIWNISSEMIRYEIMIDNLQIIYKVKIENERINIKEKPFHLEWLSYYLETGMWPQGYNESTKEAYYQFIHDTLTERPEAIIKTTESIPYYSFQQTLFREIFTLKEIGILLNTLMKLKNIDSNFLTTIIDKYLIQSNTFILESNVYILLDVFMSSLLFKVPKGRKIEDLIQEALEGVIPEVKEKDKKLKAISNFTLWEKDLELIDYYLTYGSIPIESIRMVSIDWEIMISRIIKNTPRALLFKLHFWSKSPKKINRLFDLLKIQTILSIVSIIHPELVDHFFLLEKSIDAVSGEKISLKLGFKNDTDTLKGILFIWSKMSKLQPDTTPITYKLFSKYVEKKRIQPNILLSLVIEKVKNVSSKQIQIIKEIQKFAKDTQAEKSVKKEVPPIPEGLPPESIYIANAGLILLWPFLGRYFRRLNLVGAKEFNDEASRMRAILLIQYLVTGKKEAPEYELALNKLLCGATMDMEIDMEIDITEEEINLSNSLLTGAITNWEKLKGTRIGTFRETFLQRNGSLYYMNNRWELKVEKKAYDLLLETLPWGIQMIQMSWMKERLVVLWR
jgi:hypothetical protein